MGKMSQPTKKRNKKFSTNSKHKGKSTYDVRKEEPDANSKDPRVNFDNTRISKFKKDMSEKGRNDIAWYLRNPEMMKAASSIVTGYPAGMPLYPMNTQVIPGVITAYYQTTLGSFDTIAVNQAKDSFYSYVNHANSRNYSYDPADMYLMVCAGSDIFSILGHVMRAYGVAKNYKAMNLNTPDVLLKVMGFNPSDFMSSLSTIWFDLNVFIAQSKQFWVPKDIPLLARRFWLNTNIFKDSPSEKATYYMFVQNTYYYYAGKGTTKGGALLAVPNNIPSEGQNWSKRNSYLTSNNTVSGQNWDTWRMRIQFMIDSLVNSQDRGMIMSDILKCFGPERLYQLDEIPASFQLEPVYNSEVQLQFENLTVHPGFFTKGVVQDAGNGRIYPLISNAYYRGDNAYDLPLIRQLLCPDQRMLNFHEEVTQEMLIEATRLTTAGIQPASVYVDSTDTALSTVTDISYAAEMYPTISSITMKKIKLPFAVGTEIVTALWATELEVTGYTTKQMNLGEVYISTLGTVDTTELSNAYFRERRLRIVDWAPLSYSYDMSIERTSTTLDWNLAHKNPNYVSGELDNYTVVSSELLYKLHTACTFSLLGMPMHL